MKIEYTLNEIENTAKQIWEKNNNKNIFAFDAEMGAGKTTLINAMCKQLCVKEPTSSPTYAIVNEYNGIRNNLPIKIYHMDWYRLKNAEDVLNTGATEYFANNNNICFIEWPTVALELLPSNTVFVSIQIVDENNREIVVA